MAATAIRTVLSEFDADTQARSVLDIVEFDVPEGTAARTWTDLARSQDRRELLLALSAQIDRLASGEIEEISIHAIR